MPAQRIPSDSPRHTVRGRSPRGLRQAERARRVARAAGRGRAHPDEPRPRALRAVAGRRPPARPGGERVVLCAKTKPALDFLSGQFQSKTVRRTLHALVALRPPGDRGGPRRRPRRDAAGALPASSPSTSPWARTSTRPADVSVFRRRGGKPSLTEFRVLEPFGRFAGSSAGRSRAAPTRSGCTSRGGRAGPQRRPLRRPGVVLLLSASSADTRAAGRGRPLITRLALHAGALGFLHPGSREPVEIASPSRGSSRSRSSTCGGSRAAGRAA
jgi:hypothetical protein